MSESPEFGAVFKTDIVYNEQGQTIETYQLDKRQSIAVAAKLNTALLISTGEELWKKKPLEGMMHLKDVSSVLFVAGFLSQLIE